MEHHAYELDKVSSGDDEILIQQDYNDGDKEMLNFNENDPELQCLLQFHLEPYSASSSIAEQASLFCNRSWDTLMCWPTTPAGSIAVIPCLEELEGIKYDTSQNASRLCEPNGTWANYTNYTLCKDLPHQPIEASIEVTTAIYYVGYSLSLAALGAAVAIFLYFKDLRCLRNTIHTNLMLSYIMADFMWILTITLQMSLQTELASCVALVLLLHYCHLTNFFWMFVEGLYLHVLVVETFTVENIKLRVYVCIGWGTPMLIMLVWALVKTLTPVNSASLQSQGAGYVVDMVHHCPWMAAHSFDWIYKAPAVAVLCVNLVFLVMIMWVLITKLRSATSVETQQYRKATKALLVLIPLLGITYILMIAGPSEGVSAAIYAHVRAILLSTQGFTVSLFYCFLNTEVQNTLRHHWQRWQQSRSINGVSGSRRYYNQTKDCRSPKSRTESIRLYSHPDGGRGCGGSQYRKRESCTSEVTMTTFVCNLNNGGGHTAAASALQPPPRLSPGTSNGSGANTTASNSLLVRTSPRSSSATTIQHDTSLNAPFLNNENAV